MDKTTLEELRKKRKAQEQRLIDELKYKRTCLRGAPTLPSEAEVQRKIRTFVKEIMRITKKNNFLDTFTKTKALQPALYARGEAALYRAKMESVWLQTSHGRECFRSAAEALAMCYETYKFLIVAESATRKTRDDFFAEDEDGLSLDPGITSDYVRREMDFFDEVLGTMQTEIRNAEIQISNEDHPNAMAELKQMISNMQSTVDVAVNALQQETKDLARNVTELQSLMKNIQERVSSISASQLAMEERFVVLEERRKSSQEEVRNVVKEAEGEEDLLDLDIEEEELALRDDTGVQVHEEKAQMHEEKTQVHDEKTQAHDNKTPEAS
ncbi:hypothetical protein GCK32_019631 [Trichostrongylus colubriformis]|uniref:Uncharacterized protein n=1 Tax=Trichostrongylus colubriformis TaxID=6319 RepID=A0AAN8FTM1_TRICO